MEKNYFEEPSLDFIALANEVLPQNDGGISVPTPSVSLVPDDF